MRVGIIALQHESNTFIRQVTPLDQFCAELLLTGDEIRTKLAASHHEIGGMIAELDDAQVEAVPLMAARAIPSGPVSDEAFQELLAMQLTQLNSAGTLDGLLVAPHGAMVSESVSDADGYWLGELRKHLGAAFPIMGTLDPHANLSPAMVEATDALVAYRTNPHMDQRDRGREAARLMIRKLRGEIRPVQASVFPPLAINIERQHTAEPHCCAIYDLADEQLRRAGVLSNSILLGFPYSDVTGMGSSVIAVADGDSELAHRTSVELALAIWDAASRFSDK